MIAASARTPTMAPAIAATGEPFDLDSDGSEVGPAGLEDDEVPVSTPSSKLVRE